MPNSDISTGSLPNASKESSSELRLRKSAASKLSSANDESYQDDGDGSIASRLEGYLHTLDTRLDNLEKAVFAKISNLPDALPEALHSAFVGLVSLRSDLANHTELPTDDKLSSSDKSYELTGTLANGSIEDSNKPSALLDHFLQVIDDHLFNEGVSDLPDEVTEESDYQTSLSNAISNRLTLLEERLVSVEQGIADWAAETSQKASEQLHKSTEQVQRSVQSALRVAKSRLLTYEELPHPWRENQYILRGYRFCKGYNDCLYSVCQIHNETCNIWTHLIGFMFMVGIAFWHYPSTKAFTEAQSFSDVFFMAVFLVCACKCLVLSAIWHTFSGISKLRVKQSFACFDYTGIALLIGASIMTTEYTAFYCRPTERAVYLIATALFGVGGAVLTWTPAFDKKEARPLRIGFFVSFAVAGVTGFFHAAYYHGYSETFAFYLPVLYSLLCYAAGVVFYGLLIPERWCPGGIFDYFCMSHNIWHIAVLGGIYFHYSATVRLLEGAHDFSCRV